MQSEELIPAEEFCIHHHIDISFIYSLKDSGLIELTSSGEKIYVPLAELSRLEKMVRLYYEMDINLEGIETISYLLERMYSMQQTILQLSNRLERYESA